MTNDGLGPMVAGMKPILTLLLALLLIACATNGTTDTIATTSDALQACDVVQPSALEEPLPGEVFVPESTTQTLNGERVAVASDTTEFGAQLCHTQLLSDSGNHRDWWVQCGLFQSLVVEGPTKKLIVDAGGHNSGLPPFVNGQIQPGGEELVKLLDAFNAIAPEKPIGALVASHPHQDHVGNLLLIKQQLPGVRVIVSKWFLRQAKVYGFNLVQPTIAFPGITVIHARDGQFTFDGLTFGLHTPVDVAHTSADSIVITPGHTCMVVDILQPGRLPFVDLSVVQSVEGMVVMLRYLGGLAEAGVCQQGVWGHFNVSTGPKVVEDIEQSKAWLGSLYGAFWGAMQQLQAEQLAGPAFFPSDLEDDPNDPNDPYDYHAHVGISRFFDEVLVRMDGILEPQWSGRIGYSAARGHIHEVLEEAFLYRLSSNVAAPPETFVPDFTNIPYGELPFDRYW